MQLQRILALAVLACGAVASVAAYDFDDATRTIDNDGGNREANDEDRIYGGTEADINKYPWTVSLRKTPEGQTYCGGTLVAPQYIVTAAHCVKNTTYASIGSQFAIGTKDGERIKVTDQWIHPKYVKETHVYDVAVMKLETPSTYKTLPLCKADGSQNKENAMAVVRGWGMTESNVPATTLLEVNVKLISNAVCNKSYNNRITEQMICAGQGGGKDTCQGDSGGALISSDALVGVVSWGGACGEAPGVYVRVTSVLDFINEKIGGGSATNSSDASAGSSAAPSATPTANTTPSLTTAAPTTAAPESGAATQYTKKPSATTAAPAAGTGNAAPAATTAAPAATTAAPAATTAAPAATTAAPAATTAAPAATPATPAATSATPTSGAGKPSTDKGVGGKPSTGGKGTAGKGASKCGARL